MTAGARAVEVVKPLATAPNASLRLRRAMAKPLAFLGDMQWRNGADEESVATFEEARAVAPWHRQSRRPTSRPQRPMRKPPAWQVYALVQLGRNEDAKRVGEEGLRHRRAGARETSRPHAGAARADDLRGAARQDLSEQKCSLREALALTESNAARVEGVRPPRPGNTVSWGNLVVAYQKVVRGAAADGPARGRGSGAADLAATSTGNRRRVVACEPSSRSTRDCLRCSEANRGNAKQAADALAAFGKFEIPRSRHRVRDSKRNFWKQAPDYWRAGGCASGGRRPASARARRRVRRSRISCSPADEAVNVASRMVLARTAFRNGSIGLYAKGLRSADREMTLVQALRRGTALARDVATSAKSPSNRRSRLWCSRGSTALERCAEVIAPVLEFERELSPHNRDDPTQRLRARGRALCRRAPPVWGTPPHSSAKQAR